MKIQSLYEFMVILLVTVLLLAGCTSMFTAKTRATYQVSADGSKVISYESDKEQQGLSFESGADGSVKVAVDKAITPEAAIAAALAIQTELMKRLTELIAQGKMAGS